MREKSTPRREAAGASPRSVDGDTTAPVGSDRSSATGGGHLSHLDPQPSTLNPIPYSLVPAPLFLTVSDVKQFVYCPRVVYFTYCVPVRRRVTYKMKEGKLQHEANEDLEARRTLRTYGLKEGERAFNVRLQSERLGLSGLLDMVIVTPREAIPVEFKNSEGPLSLNHKYQLAAYTLLVEDKWETPVRRCFVYFIPLKRSREVPMTPNARRYVKRVCEDMRAMISAERMPEPTRHRGRCVDCEFGNYCRDR